MRLSAIGPFHAPLKLLGGLDPKSRDYPDILAAVPSGDETIHVPNRGNTRRDFSDLDRDDLDLRLLVWTPKVEDGAPTLRFHVYANGIGVVEVHFECPDMFDADTLEEQVQSISCQAIDDHGPQLYALLRAIASRVPTHLIEEPVPPVEEEKPLSGELAWISRAVRMTPEQRMDASYRKLVKAWLANTADPKEADAILEGESARAISWMNYVIVDDPKKPAANPLSAVRIAQFFFAAQNRLNETVHSLLRDGEFDENTRRFKAQLIHARSDMQMLRILYDMQLGLLSRQKRRDLDYLMKTWDFETLTRNGERIIEASSERIDEITNARSERGAFYTDMILAFIALVSIIEVTLYLTEYSREVMSRPTLAYQDNKLSWLLSWFASIDMDQGFLSGAALFFIMAGLYVYWKRR